jgi:hypothetical protein
MAALPRRVLIARIIAVAADAVQLGLFPLFVGGVPAGFDAVLDLVVAAALTALVGWHWAFLPAFIAEILPGVDLVPTWTLAAFIATRGRGAARRSASAVRVEPPPPPALPPKTPV